MIKILILFTIIGIILTGCQNKELSQVEDEFEFKQKISGVNIYLPKNWLTKRGIYGDYYNEIQNFILYKDIETDNPEKEIIESLNFYRHDDFKMTEEFSNLLSNNEIEIERKNNIFKYIKGKKLDKVIVLIASKNKENLNDIYEKVFK